MKPEEIDKLVRPNIQKLIPYEAARHLMNEPAILLDANENPYESGLNRYPDPWQRQLKEKIGKIKNFPVDQIFIGNGSDEIIDLVIRIFCEPGKDYIITTPPTYGMYKVSAGINNVENVEVVLDDSFDVKVGDILDRNNSSNKLLFLCSPNNPTGNNLSSDKIQSLLDNFRGIIVLDEAYIDFSSQPSWIDKIESYPNLLVMQTLSKAYGLAGVRLGVAFASEKLIGLLNKVKPPYNISTPNQQVALNALNDIEKVLQEVSIIKKEKLNLEDELRQLTIVEKIFPSEANFLLVRMTDANAIFDFLKKSGVIIRNRSNVAKCEGCLRITVGTEHENSLLIEKLKEYEKTTSPVH